MLLIKNAHVFTPKDIGTKDILINFDRIVSIEDEIDLNIPHEVFDAKGAKVVPGFIDQHVHVLGGGGEGGPSTRVPELELSTCIESGVTSLVGMLGTDGYTRNIRSLVAKIKGLKAEGISAYCLTGSYEVPSPTLTGKVADDLIYIDEIIGCKIALADHRSSQPTKEELKRLLSQIRIGGMMGGKAGYLHIHMGVGKGGLDTIFDILEETDIPVKHIRPTHIANNTEHAKKLADMGGRVDFTAKDPEGTADFLEEFMPQIDTSLLTMSSDSNGSMPKWNDKNEMIGLTAGKMNTLHGGLKEMVKRGHGLEEVLPIITSNVAKAIEKYPQKGCLEVGSDADMLVLSDDLEIETVIARGEFLKKENEILAKGTFE